MTGELQTSTQTRDPLLIKKKRPKAGFAKIQIQTSDDKRASDKYTDKRTPAAKKRPKAGFSKREPQTSTWTRETLAH